MVVEAAHVRRGSICPGKNIRSNYSNCVIGNFCMYFCAKRGKCKKLMAPDNKCRWCRNTFSGQLSTDLAFMLPRVTCGQSVGLCPIGGRDHFRSHDSILSVMAEKPLLYATSWLYLLQNHSYCRLQFYIARIGNLTFFAENSGKYEIFYLYHKINADDAKAMKCVHIKWL